MLINMCQDNLYVGLSIIALFRDNQSSPEYADNEAWAAIFHFGRFDLPKIHTSHRHFHKIQAI